ncbi:MAG: hypothetical protein FI717_11230 [SAR202 cluster bacterium]|nr:hypothetical protein [SAR202 cluster bacterium]
MEQPDMASRNNSTASTTSSDPTCWGSSLRNAWSTASKRAATILSGLAMLQASGMAGATISTV